MFSHEEVQRDGSKVTHETESVSPAALGALSVILGLLDGFLLVLGAFVVRLKTRFVELFLRRRSMNGGKARGVEV